MNKIQVPEAPMAVGPSLAALLISLAAHFGLVAAILASNFLHVQPPAPEPEPMAVTVSFVADPATRNEVEHEVRKGDPDVETTETAAPEKNDLPETEKAPSPETFIKPDDLPAKIPVPVRKPKSERRHTDEIARDKTKTAKPRGLEQDPKPDMMLSDEYAKAGVMDSTRIAMLSRGVARNVKIEQKWLAQLAAHLERRKRYPHAAISKRQQGLVTVSFRVNPDGMISDPRIVGSSGIALLDEEVIELLRRASPVPAPPSEANPYVTVPISFTIKR